MKLAGSGQEFEVAQSMLSKAMSAQGRSLDWYTKRWYPYPVLLTPTEVHNLLRLQELIYTALQAIVPRYLHDPRLQQRIPLSPWARELFTELDGTPYHPGALRPDFLIRPDDSVQVCEINGRFPLNGFFISLYAQELLAEVDPAYIAPGNLHRLREELLTDGVTIVKSEERGYDLFLFEAELKVRGLSSRIASHQDFAQTLDGNRVMLELHLHELQQLPLEFLIRLHRERHYFNDLRTVILAHDKRLLAVLSDEELLSNFLPSNQAHTLAGQITPTFTLGRPPNMEAERWVLKPAHKGKGEGIRFCEQDGLVPGCVLQPEVRQKVFSLHDGTDVRLVGLLPMWGQSFYGPGIFRAGEGPVVNLSDGGLLLGAGLGS
jgi:hypothetical protein